MPLLNDETAEAVTRFFSDLSGPVRLLMFTSPWMDDMWSDTSRLLMEIAGLSEKVSFEVLDALKETETAGASGIPRVPAIAVLGQEDFGIRFLGAPTGYMFEPLVQSVRMVSLQQTNLGRETVNYLSQLDFPVRLQVFTRNT